MGRFPAEKGSLFRILVALSLLKQGSVAAFSEAALAAEKTGFRLTCRQLLTEQRGSMWKPREHTLTGKVNRGRIPLGHPPA